ncbi:Peptide methionine sulfoxide reductase MsrA [Sphingomonas antarctica]|uniref:peptide-methionine (S)-S-oxide reductase MsrA n=1 Tax=Sphingomonas antarctica TaxID=2040274 RepID=UPI0039E8DB61
MSALRRLLTGAAVAAAALGVATLAPLAQAAERTVLVPVAKTDVAARGNTATAVLAGGCFWGMEAVFSHVKGVRQVVSGYAGGTAQTANYETVSTETTHHAEAVRITYDPRQVSYATLLRVYFSVAHNPTELNRQGPDSGTSYRSAIFPQSPDQARVARAYIAQLNAAHSWGGPLATKVESGGFFPAEAYHQNFARLNPQHGYIRMWDAPKLTAFQHTLPQLYTPAWAA